MYVPIEQVNDAITALNNRIARRNHEPVVHQRP
jgi:hypothetical protein